MNPHDTLKKNNLRITSSRLEILQVFIDNSFALSESDIEGMISNNCDRATIYRTINTFLEEGIIHKVLDSQHVVKYALCRDDCQDGHHRHEHIHFKCNCCGNTTCLEGIAIQPIQLPEGFKLQEVNLLVVGVCKKCNVTG
ncbi:MAG: transcriptional repressor [Flammeovirgaceae bacterium]|nr:transcriptional repressor [Flammeovirgaceae bacterium]MDW8287848.1 transcriptional repressor [Flammeovirgaceae bacterium]